MTFSPIKEIGEKPGRAGYAPAGLVQYGFPPLMWGQIFTFTDRQENGAAGKGSYKKKRRGSPEIVRTTGREQEVTVYE
jgi:hypothetical protein